jgi:hypothetical protein
MQRLVEQVVLGGAFLSALWRSVELKGKDVEYTEEQIKEFQEEFAKRRKAQIILAIVAAVVAFAIAAFSKTWSGALAGNGYVLLGSLFVLVLATVFFAIRLGRCPACGGLMSNSWRTRYCSLCGVPLR